MWPHIYSMINPLTSFFPHSQKQGLKKPKKHYNYILHAEEDVQHRQSSKYFWSPQSSVVCINRKNPDVLISLLLLLQKKCSLLALVKELEILASYLKQSGINTCICTIKLISSQFPVALLICQYWFQGAYVRFNSLSSYSTSQEQYKGRMKSLARLRNCM